MTSQTFRSTDYVPYIVPYIVRSRRVNALVKLHNDSSNVYKIKYQNTEYPAHPRLPIRTPCILGTQRILVSPYVPRVYWEPSASLFAHTYPVYIGNPAHPRLSIRTPCILGTQSILVSPYVPRVYWEPRASSFPHMYPVYIGNPAHPRFPIRTPCILGTLAVFRNGRPDAANSSLMATSCKNN
jgi:hypothetical protein